MLVEENAVELNDHVQGGTPKTHERRAVVYPAFLGHVGARSDKGQGGRRPPALAGGARGYLWPGNAVSGRFVGAVRRIRTEDAEAAAKAKKRGEEAPPIMPRVTPHDLRTPVASLAISAGANVKAVQRILGHASAAMKLDTYAEPFDDDPDSVAVTLDSQRSASVAS